MEQLQSQQQQQQHNGRWWVDRFDKARKATPVDSRRLYELRVLIADQTMDYCNKGYYYCPISYENNGNNGGSSSNSNSNSNNGDIVRLSKELVEKSVREQRLFRNVDLKDKLQKRKNILHDDDDGSDNNVTMIEVKNMDCLDAASEEIEMTNGTANPVVLNMASASNPGGGWLHGSGAQEENLFRRSTYHLALNRKYCNYPLDDAGGVYTPHVQVFRSNESTGYELLRNPMAVSFVAIAAINRPSLTLDGKRLMPEFEMRTKEKIRSLFRICDKMGHDTLILSALGCGAFRNPPAHIAELFHQILNEEEFHNRFKKIVFAIINDHNARNEGNFKPFEREFIRSSTVEEVGQDHNNNNKV